MNEKKTTLKDRANFGPEMTQSGPKVTRLRISKTQHTALLEAVCKQLGSDRPIDALEHILNCWLVGNIPASTVIPVTPIEPVTHIEQEIDEFSELMEF